MALIWDFLKPSHVMIRLEALISILGSIGNVSELELTHGRLWEKSAPLVR